MGSRVGAPACFLNDRRDAEGDSMLILGSLWRLSCLKRARVMQITCNDTIFPFAQKQLSGCRRQVQGLHWCRRHL